MFHSTKHNKVKSKKNTCNLPHCSLYHNNKRYPSRFDLIHTHIETNEYAFVLQGNLTACKQHWHRMCPIHRHRLIPIRLNEEFQRYPKNIKNVVERFKI